MRRVVGALTVAVVAACSKPAAPLPEVPTTSPIPMSPIVKADLVRWHEAAAASDASRVAYAMALTMAGRRDLARQVLEATTHPQAVVGLAMLDADAGRADAVEARMANLQLTDDRQRAALELMRARATFHAGRVEDAVKLARQAVALDGAAALPRSDLAFYLSFTRDPRAIEALEDAIEAAENATLLAARALWWKRQGDPRAEDALVEARNRLEERLGDSPDLCRERVLAVALAAPPPASPHAEVARALGCAPLPSAL